MAASARVRARARELFVVGNYSADETAARVGVAASTIKRWAKDGRWQFAREETRRLEALAPQVALQLLAAAVETRDPQATFAGLNAAELAGLRKPEQPHPAPEKVARAFIRVISAHPEVGPVVRRHSAEIVRLVAAAVEEVEQSGA